MLQAMLARERARAEFQDWEKKEEEVFMSFYITTFLLLLMYTFMQCFYLPVIWFTFLNSSILTKAKSDLGLDCVKDVQGP